MNINNYLFAFMLLAIIASACGEKATSDETATDSDITSNTPTSDKKEIAEAAETFDIKAGMYGDIKINVADGVVTSEYKEEIQDGKFSCWMNFTGKLEDKITANQIKISLSEEEGGQVGKLTKVSDTEIAIHFPEALGGCWNVNPDMADVTSDLGMVIKLKE